LEESSAFHKSPFANLSIVAPKYPSSRVDARRLNEGCTKDLEFGWQGKNPSRFGSYLPKRL
jgi:hypothetical protein